MDAVTAAYANASHGYGLLDAPAAGSGGDVFGSGDKHLDLAAEEAQQVREPLPVLGCVQADRGAAQDVLRVAVARITGLLTGEAPRRGDGRVVGHVLVVVGRAVGELREGGNAVHERNTSAVAGVRHGRGFILTLGSYSVLGATQCLLVSGHHLEALLDRSAVSRLEGLGWLNTGHFGHGRRRLEAIGGRRRPPALHVAVGRERHGDRNIIVCRDRCCRRHGPLALFPPQLCGRGSHHVGGIGA
mmetsp:Transcript_34840/g.103890  ORF Transcript_34840/g.103890 Transcript_34840/m.103890 type:complete len:244 (-) Transcript_34840:674-1405(-)